MFTDCMHWHYDVDYEPETVTRICLTCGAIGSIARCQATTQRGTQCKHYVLAGICGTHGAQS